jgi:hypothetical protein
MSASKIYRSRLTLFAGPQVAVLSEKTSFVSENMCVSRNKFNHEFIVNYCKALYF